MAKSIELNDHASRDHALLSASSAERWMTCPASAKLASGYPRKDTPFTLEGTKAHEVAEAIASGRIKPENVETNEDTGIDEDMVRHATSYRDYILGLCDENTTVMLEQRVDYSPWVPEGFGTADCILMHDDTMDVIDYKYGKGVTVSAEHNKQMQLYGLGALNEYGYVYDITRVRLHIFQPRKDNISTWETTAADLQKFGEFATAAAKCALDDNPQMAAGAHCKFCPHAAKCPELARTCINKVAVGGDTIAPEPVSLTPEAVAYILGLEGMITAWLKSVKETALEDMTNGKEVPGYKLVEGRQGDRKWADEAKVVEALELAGIAREKYTTVQIMGPAAMEKAIGKKKTVSLLGGLVTRAPGSPTIAPANDKRPALDRVAQAQDDFKEESK